MYFWSMPILRPYNPSDHQQVLNLFLFNTPQYFCPPEQNDLEQFLKEHAPTYFVLEESGLIIASGGYHIDGNIGKLSWYMVHPQYHQKGMGSILINNSLKILQENLRLTKIEALTSQLAYRFYEKFGFILLATQENYWGPDMHLYQMELSR